jgi:streptomycin 6-kinase
VVPTSSEYVVPATGRHRLHPDEPSAECDLGVMMRNDPLELLDGGPWARAHWLAERCGLDAAAIWEWGVVERVTSGLRCTQINLEPLGRHMLKAADRLATL